MKLPLAVIVGPTAAGKTAAAVETAAMLNGEVISADSMQVYRGMDIGTAKITPAEMQAADGTIVPHHLLDVVDPDEDYSVARYQEDARALIADINQRGKLPLLVGGTGLYIQAVVDRYQFQQEPGSSKLRQKLLDKMEVVGKTAMHGELAQIDPNAAKKIHPNDIRRIIRALEYYYSTGKKISDSRTHRQESIYNLAMAGLTMERPVLYHRINRRVDQMLAAGLLDEVRGLLKRGYSQDLVSMQGLGYRQMAAYLNGEISFEEAVRLLKRDTRRFAKRQMTWFNRDRRIFWLDVTGTDAKSAAEKLSAYLSRTLGKGVEYS